MTTEKCKQMTSRDKHVDGSSEVAAKVGWPSYRGVLSREFKATLR